jgi:hypothetical protein
MSNPTSNFGWQMPTATDLVTDLPADFEVFGQAVDTALMDLKGGTTGQVLAKASNTDMDFVWSADAAGMTNPMTTTGDTIYSSSGSTPARLGIGSASQVLTVTSGIPSWQTPAAGGGMTLISTTTLSGTSTTLSSIPGTYKALILYFRDMFCSTDDSFRIRFNSDATSNAYSYAGCSFEGNTSGTGAAVMGVLDTSVMLQQQATPSAAANDNAATMKLYDYANTAAFKFFESDSYMTTPSRKQIESKRGFWKNTSAISSILITNAGGFTQNGTVLLYGVA